MDIRNFAIFEISFIATALDIISIIQTGNGCLQARNAVGMCEIVYALCAGD